MQTGRATLEMFDTGTSQGRFGAPALACRVLNSLLMRSVGFRRGLLRILSDTLQCTVTGRDQCAALFNLVIARKTERCGFAGMMTAGTLGEDNRRNVLCKCDRTIETARGQKRWRNEK